MAQLPWHMRNGDNTNPFPPPHAPSADPDYQAFLKQLEEGPTALPSATAQLEQAESAARTSAAGEPVVTSLMAFLREKYASKPFKRGSKPRRGVPVIVEVRGRCGGSTGVPNRSLTSA